MNKESVEIINRLRAILQDSWINNFGYQGFITYEYSLKNPYQKPFDFIRVKV